MAESSARRVTVIAAAVGALVGGAVAGAVGVASASGRDGGTVSPPGGGGTVATAPVVRTTLSTTVQAGGSIGYEGNYAIAALGGSQGVYTSLPEPGEVIRQDQPAYSVNDQPVPLLYGSIPAYRAFDAGMSGGADVGQLTHDLIALGYGEGLAQSNYYTAATAAAVERWQTALGVPATGEIPLGAVVFEPGPVRVTSVIPSAGAAVGAGTVLTASSTTPIVSVDLPVGQEYLVAPGDTVSVVLSDGTTTVGGHIETVGSVATCPGGSDVGTGASAAGQSACSAAGSNSNASATVPVTITMDSTPAGATLDQAPVNVNITTQRADNVLAVPVNALLALAGGGFGVDVVTGRASRLVGVTTGLYGSNLVQVSGSGIAAGMRVEVPAS